MNRIVPILLAVLALTASAFSTGREAAPAVAMSVEAAPARVDLTQEDMEEIRAAAIRYCAEKKLEDWEAYAQELRRGALFMNEHEEPRIGIWRIEQEDGLDLVRWSVDSPALYAMLILAREEGRWIVTGDSYREEFLIPAD